MLWMQQIFQHANIVTIIFESKKSDSNQKIRFFNFFKIMTFSNPGIIAGAQVTNAAL